MNRDEILIKTIPLFQRMGIKYLTQRKLVEELRISKGTFYQHFANRDQLVELVVKKLIQDLRSSIEEIVAMKENPLIKIAKVYDASISFSIKFSSCFYLDLKKYHSEINIELERFKFELINQYILKLFIVAKQKGYLHEGINLNLVCEIHLFRIKDFLENSLFHGKADYPDLFNSLIINNLRGTVKKKYHNIFNDYNIRASIN